MFLCSVKLFLLKLLYDDDWCTNILTILFIVSGKWTHQCKYNGSWWDCHQSERVNAIKPGLNHHFLHLKMPVPSQEYDSSCPFVFDAFCYLILPWHDYGLSELIFLWVQYFCDFTFFVFLSFIFAYVLCVFVGIFFVQWLRL